MVMDLLSCYMEITVFRALEGYDKTLVRKYDSYLAVSAVCSVRVLIRHHPELVAVAAVPYAVSAYSVDKV